MLVDFYLFYAFVLQKSLLKKIWNCPGGLIYYVHSPQPLYGELFFTNLAPIFFTTFTYLCLCVLLFICENLSSYLPEPIFICQNLFLFVRTYFYQSEPIFICLHLLSVRIFSCLWSSLRISFYLWYSVRICFF